MRLIVDLRRVLLSEYHTTVALLILYFTGLRVVLSLIQGRLLN